MTMDLGSVKKDFSALLSQIQPWTLSHFVMWLDIKVAEYKVFGHMILDNTPNDTPQWLRGKTYLDQYKDTPEPSSLSPVAAPSVSPRTSHPSTSLRSSLQMYSTCEPIVSFANSTASSGVYSVSTVNTTVVSPAVSPAYPAVSQSRTHLFTEPYHKQAPQIQSPEAYSKLPPIAQFHGYPPSQEPQRIPPISHLSPKHIRQTHLEHSLTRPPHLSGKDMLTAAEVETQIAVLQSQIAAVNRNLSQSQIAQTSETVTQTSQRGRKSSHEMVETNTSYTPPYAKRSRQQSPVANRSTSAETVNNVPLPRPDLDMLSRYHRLDSDGGVSETGRTQTLQSISDLMRSQNLQSIPDALRVQSIINNTESQVPPVPVAPLATDPTIQNTAQDMTITHSTVERETNHSQGSVQVKKEASDEDSGSAAPFPHPETPSEEHQAPSLQGKSGEETADEQSGQSYPVSMYPTSGNTSGMSEEKAAADITTKKMRRKFLESMKNSNPKYYSHQIQQIIPFPEKFPVANLDYGLKALQMIQTGEITRAGKIQLIDTIFHELIKYTGLYPTPTQKMAVANSIVETFPTLAAKMKASHISPADSWYVILCDKFRNERRGLSSGGTPRVGKIAKMVKKESETGPVADSPEDVSAVEPSVSDEGPAEESPQPAPAPPPAPPQQTYSQSSGQITPPAYPQGYEQPQQPSESEEEEEDDQMTQMTQKLLMDAKERQLYAEQITKTLKKRSQPASTDDITLDERYAASLLQYYSKHKPFYPTYTDPGKTGYTDVTKGSYPGYAEMKPEETFASPESVPQYPDDKTPTLPGEEDLSSVPREGTGDVSSIVQSVVEAHMEEIMASRMQQGTEETNRGAGEVPPISKIFQKKKPRPAPREQTPEQIHVKQQRFIQKVGLTFPGVQVLDEATLECTCGTKVKLGRSRMLHNYTNYHLRRCPKPPPQPSGVLPASLAYDQSALAGMPGSIYEIDADGKVITSETLSATLDIPMSGPEVEAETEKDDSLLDLSQASDMPEEEYPPTTSSTESMATADLQIPVPGPDVALELTAEMSATGSPQLATNTMMGAITNPSPEPDIIEQEVILPAVPEVDDMETDQDNQDNQSECRVQVIMQPEDQPINLADT